MGRKSIKDKVWEKTPTIRGEDPEVWRRDVEGNKIRYGSYGTHGEFGWQIDHKKPSAKGGTDTLQNYQALQWEENEKKSDKYPKT